MNTLTRSYQPSADLRGSCANPEVRPDWFPTIGEYYTHWQVIIRVTAIGCDLDAHQPLPNCIAFETIGWRSLFGAYWRFDFTRPDGRPHGT